MDAAIIRLVRDRAGGRCEYCHDPESLALVAFHCEHIVARQHGGADQAENLALACPDCNFRKGPNLTSIDPVSGELTRLFRPRTDSWNDHFVLRGSFVNGRTEIGRATVQLLGFNSTVRQHHRRLLLALGLLP